MAVDLGQIHVAATSTGLILNGRQLRSLKQWRNKKLADLSSKIETKKKGSARQRELRRKKRRFLEKVDHRIDDILHKYTTGLVSTCTETGMDTLVVGDLSGFREKNNNGRARNQENHGWLYGRITWMLQYKCSINGINFRKQNESYTSQECPSCGNRKKMRGRDYICPCCGFNGHRDLVGARNILRKYLGSSAPVVGGMAPPFGVRYKPDLVVARGFQSTRTCGALAPA